MTATNTLVLHTGPASGVGARAMLPQLPGPCFVTAATLPELTGHAEQAGARALRQLVLVGTTAELAALVPPDTHADVTLAMGGPPDLAERVEAQGPEELWTAAGLLGTCGRELCRRVAAILTERGGDELAVQVVMVDREGRRMVGMYGRLAR